MKYFLIALLLSFALLSKAQHEINVEDIKKHITILAHDSLEGRGTGSSGNNKAAKYIAEQFKSYGLQLLGEKGFQAFDILLDVKEGVNNKFEFAKTKGEYRKNFATLGFSGNGTVKAEAVFCGFGYEINTTSLVWDDYKDVNVKDKWVIILRGDFDSKNSFSPFAPYSRDRFKVMTARDNNAAGVILVSGKTFSDTDDLSPLKVDKSGGNTGIPVIQITRELANEILKKSNKTIDDLEKEIIKSRKPISFSTDIKINATTDMLENKSKTQNVVAQIFGNNPSLSKEFILIGAHYDHLGFGGLGSGSRQPDVTAVHNGADDNASGTAAMLALAKYFADHQKNLRRSIIFVAFSGEELGLLGSAFFVKNPFYNLSQIKSMFNFDMVGRLNEQKELTVYGTGTSVEIDSILKLYSKKTDFKINYVKDGFGPSDHSSFYGAGIPVTFFFTGLEDQYHTPKDDVELINFQGEKNILDFATNVILDIVNRDKPLTYTKSDEKPNMGSDRTYKVTLGIVPGMDNADNKGLRVDGVRKGGPAEKAGIQKGDVITSIDGKTIQNIYEYMERLNTLKKGETYSVEINRNGIKIKMNVSL